MKKTLMGVALAASMISPARADMIQAVFTGTIAPGMLGTFVVGTPEVSYAEAVLGGRAFQATFLFDTSRATSVTVTSYGFNEAIGGILHADIAIDGFGSFLGNYWWTDSLLGWNDDFTLAYANAYFGGYEFIDISHGYGSYFQTGPCPGGPCGRLVTTGVTVTNLSAPIVTLAAAPVPGPIVGGGLPGLLLLLLGLWRARRD